MGAPLAPKMPVVPVASSMGGTSQGLGRCSRGLLTTESSLRFASDHDAPHLAKRLGAGRLGQRRDDGYEL